MKSHFKFNKQERSGIFFLILLILGLQGLYFFVKWNSYTKNDSSFTLDEEAQIVIDSLKRQAAKGDITKHYPFNPNFITDYKGYTLGLSPIEIDRLYEFRDQNKFVNSAEEFQRVTGISDSLLGEISPFFKFPNWTKENLTRASSQPISSHQANANIAKKDLNSASVEGLKRVNGIGDKLAARIVKFRESLGGFLVAEQLYDVYGLDADVVERVLERYSVLNPPQINKINLNEASKDEIASLVYINYDMASKIIAYRQVNGRINSFDELIDLGGFPKEKIDRIALYLSL